MKLGETVKRVVIFLKSWHIVPFLMLDFNAKTNWTLLVITVVLGLAVGVAILLFVSTQAPFFQQVDVPASISSPQPQQQSTNNNQQSEIDTSNWQTYRNEEFGFEITYPNSWGMTESLTDWATKGVRSIGVEGADSERGFSVQQYTNPKNLSLDEWWDKSTLVCDEEGMNCRPTIKRAASKITVDGRPGYKVLGNTSYFEIFTFNEGNLYILYGWARNETELRIINEILSTFRFVEPKGASSQACEWHNDCPQNSICYNSAPAFLTPEGVEQGPKEGDGLCHRRCTTNADCATAGEGTCVEQDIFIGDVGGPEKFCSLPISNP